MCVKEGTSSHNISQGPTESGRSSKGDFPRKAPKLHVYPWKLSKFLELGLIVSFGYKDLGNVLYRDSDKVRSALPLRFRSSNGYNCRDIV